MIVLGIDPDTKTTGLGLLNDGKPIYAHLIEVPDRKAKVNVRILRMVDAVESFLSNFRVEQPEGAAIEKIVIEGQRHRPGSKVRPQDLIHLAQVAGAIAGVCSALWPGVQIVMPEPTAWKGSVKKDVFTRRILKDLGLELSEKGGLQFADAKVTVRLPGTTKLKKSDSSHPIDGLGLALWGYRNTSLREMSR